MKYRDGLRYGNLPGLRRHAHARRRGNGNPSPTRPVQTARDRFFEPRACIFSVFLQSTFVWLIADCTGKSRPSRPLMDELRLVANSVKNRWALARGFGLSPVSAAAAFSTVENDRESCLPPPPPICSGGRVRVRSLSGETQVTRFQIHAS